MQFFFGHLCYFTGYYCCTLSTKGKVWKFCLFTEISEIYMSQTGKIMQGIEQGFVHAVMWVGLLLRGIPITWLIRFILSSSGIYFQYPISNRLFVTAKFVLKWVLEFDHNLKHPNPPQARKWRVWISMRGSHAHSPSNTMQLLRLRASIYVCGIF